MKVKLSCITGLLLLNSACTHVSDQSPVRDALTAFSVPEKFQASSMQARSSVNGLLDLFDDIVLRELIERSSKNNLDIQLAAKRLEEVVFLADAELGNLLPQISGNISASRSKIDQGTIESVVTPSLDVSWEIDVWGKLRNQQTSQKHLVFAARHDYRAVRSSVAAQVMNAWFDVVLERKRILLEQQRVKNLRVNAQRIERNFESGLSALDDLAAVEQQIFQINAVLLQNTGNHNRAVRKLEILLGEYPDGRIYQRYQLPNLPASLAPSVPAALLTERPDLRALWEQILSADKSVKIAQKEMYPKISLTGSVGSQGSGFSEFLSGTTVWSLASNLTVPLFNASQLRKNVSVARTRAEQSWIKYLQAVQRAFGEVEQALEQETLLANQEKEQLQALKRALHTAQIFRERYKSGLVNIIDYLTTQNAAFDVERDLLQVRNARLKNRVTLALAIGKGL